MIPGVPVFAEPVLGDQAPEGRLSGYEAFLGRSDREGLYLADVEIRRRDEAALFDAPTHIFGDPVFTDPPQGGYSAGARRTLFFSSGDWVGPPDDGRRRNVVARPRLRAAINATRTFPFFPDESSAVQGTDGYIELANDDGAFDWITAAGTVAGLRQRVYHGPRRGYFDDFDQRLFALGKSTEGRANRVRINLENDVSPLTRPIAQRYYTGDGGPEGDLPLEGLAVATALGPCFNVPCLRISAEFEVWQPAEGPLFAINVVKERGVPLDGTSDYPTWAALIQADIPEFHYATCKALGLIRFATPPTGPVHADIQGYVDDGDYLSTLPQQAEYLLRFRAGLDATEIDRAALLSVGNQEASYFSGTADTQIVDWFDRAARSLIGFHGRGKTGRYRIKGVIAPERVAPPRPIPVPGVFIAPEAAETYVRSEQTVYYRTNWGVMAPQDVAEALPESTRADLQRKGLSVTVQNGSAAAAYAESARPGEDIDTIFTQRPGAQATAQNAIELFGLERDIFSAPVGKRGFGLDGGDYVTFSTDRYGADGKVFIVREIQERSEGESMTLRVFGSAERLPS